MKHRSWQTNDENQLYPTWFSSISIFQSILTLDSHSLSLSLSLVTRERHRVSARARTVCSVLVCCWVKGYWKEISPCVLFWHVGSCLRASEEPGTWRLWVVSCHLFFFLFFLLSWLLTRVLLSVLFQSRIPMEEAWTRLVCCCRCCFCRRRSTVSTLQSPALVQQLRHWSSSFASLLASPSASKLLLYFGR